MSEIQQAPYHNKNYVNVVGLNHDQIFNANEQNFNNSSTRILNANSNVNRFNRATNDTDDNLYPTLKY